MRFLDLFRRKAETEDRSAERFTHGGPVPEWLGLQSATGIAVNEQTVENLATVSACVGAIASAIGSLPPRIYRPSGTGREELTAHPVNRLLRAPWGLLTWPDWCEWAMSQALLHGNALAEILSDGRGTITGLRPIPWRHVQPAVLPDGRQVFHVSLPGEQRRRLTAAQVFYIKDRSDDGLVGRSRISRAPDAVGNAISLQAFSAHAWANQAQPSGAVEIDGALNQANYERLRAQFTQNYTGPKHAGKVLILDNKAQWKSISVSPEDAEVLASRRFSVEELCRLFQVPPPIVQDYTHNTFTNSAQASLWFAQFSLAPWCRKIEAEFARTVFTGDDGAHLEIDLSGLMRGDFETRWKAWEIAVKNDILDRNEVREMEGWGPRAVTEAPVV
ncbi:MAG: phage portal protein [Novosphingobium sp.]